MAKRERSRTARSAAAKKGWKTRKKRAREAEQNSRSRARSRAAKKGWKTRREKQFLAEGMHPKSAHEWAELPAKRAERLEFYVDSSIGYYGYLRGPDRVRFAKEFLELERKRYNEMVRILEKMHFTPSQIRTAFFSPKAFKV